MWSNEKKEQYDEQTQRILICLYIADADCDMMPGANV